MSFRTALFALLAVVALTAAACVPVAVPASAAPAADSQVESAPAVPREESTTVLAFDVAEDMTRFAFDETKVYDDGLPAHGSAFVTMGYILEHGALDDPEAINPDGTPANPEQVIGTWVCRGWFINDAAHASEGEWVITTQLFFFDEAHGGGQLVTDGFELAAVGVPGVRAITGGTGPYRNARGEAAQTLLGFNASEGVNLRYQIEVNR